MEKLYYADEANKQEEPRKNNNNSIAIHFISFYVEHIVNKCQEPNESKGKNKIECWRAKDEGSKRDGARNWAKEWNKWKSGA